MLQTSQEGESPKFVFRVTKVKGSFLLQKFHSSHFLPAAFVERAFHCSWTTSEEKCMDGLCAVSSGFHRSMTHLKMIMAKLVTLLP